MAKSNWLNVAKSNVRSDGTRSGVAEGVEDGEAHVSDGDLGEDAAVYEFDE